MSPYMGSFVLWRGETRKRMNEKMQRTVKTVKMAIQEHSPQILTGIGIMGMVSTTVMAVRATPKALYLLEDNKAALEKETKMETGIEIVKITWKCYIPAAILGSISIVCLISANSLNAKKNAALTTAYAISESALKNYQEKVVETIGKNKEQSVRDAMAKDAISKKPIHNSEVIITKKGDTLCFDVLSGRYFKSDIERIKRAENDINRKMMDEMTVCLNEFYEEIGLSGTSIGYDIGWNIDRGFIDIVFSSQLADDGTPCLVIDYRNPPVYGYEKIN